MTARCLILVNGSLVSFSNSFRGLRQGDPLSLLLFVLVMEVFNRMISTMVNNGCLAGFSVGDISQSTLNISHLLFAEDTLMFCEVDHNQIRALLQLCFEAVSGLK